MILAVIIIQNKANLQILWFGKFDQ